MAAAIHLKFEEIPAIIYFLAMALPITSSEFALHSVTLFQKSNAKGDDIKLFPIPVQETNFVQSEKNITGVAVVDATGRSVRIYSLTS